VQVLRLDETGAVRRLRIKRRDLLREHRLQPRDLRRIDPTIDFTKTSPSITIKEDVLLLNLGGIRSAAAAAAVGAITASELGMATAALALGLGQARQQRKLVAG
jgi:hypothetical protein